ncbi:hypothetical protein BaRGS_00037403, partial [Batillaria attramentaria]
GIVFSRHYCATVPWTSHQHNVEIEVCPCDDTLVTLLRHHLWAASPKNPSLAIHLDLMEWARDLHSVYRRIIQNSVNEYRHFKHRLQATANLPEECALDDGTSCPPCNGDPVSKKILCIDGNFGLVRKNSSGFSLFEPRHTKYFINQASVDSFVHANTRTRGMPFRPAAIRPNEAGNPSVPCIWSQASLSGVGLVDGETLKRLWSYLRSFGPMTKEMRASKRVDLLSDALTHYAVKQRMRLGQAFTNRIDRAKKVKMDAEQEVITLTQEVEGVTDDIIKTWAQRDIETLKNESRKPSISSSEDYALKLSVLYSARSEVESDICRLEAKYGFKRQDWGPESDQYLEKVALAAEKQRQSLLQKIRQEALDRKYLINSLRKYGSKHQILNKFSRFFKQVVAAFSKRERCIEEEHLIVQDLQAAFTWYKAEHDAIMSVMRNVLSVDM